MPIIGHRSTTIRVVGFMSGETCVTQFEYIELTEIAPTTHAEEVAEEFLASVIPAWTACISELFHFSAIEYSESGPGGFDSGFLDISLISGGVVGEVLPSYNTFGMIKVVDPLNNEFQDGKPMKNGAFRISGVPESAQNNRVINAPFLVNLAALGAAVQELAVGGDTWTLYIERPDPENLYVGPAAAAAIIEVRPGKLGTQNTRK